MLAHGGRSEEVVLYTVPGTPPHEAERLAAVQAIKLLDTPPEERFDRIARLASRVFDVPMAFLSVVDADRQWFKTRIGMASAETPRAMSFCGHAILQQEPLIVADALEDARFRGNPLVTGEPHIRFYAGHPLAGPGGHNVGTLCIADTQPRQLTEEEQRLFRDLAALAEKEVNMFDLIQTQHELIETKNALIAAQQQLHRELAEAAAYVRGLLPPPISEPVHIDWVFETSSQLGGDLFGYHWLDDHRLAIYLFDVCGHGVGASLLASTIYSALRNQTLRDARFDNPGRVLRALNQTFPMSQHGHKYFTVWYGVYDLPLGALHYCSAGHPPALLFDGTGAAPQQLATPSLVCGMAADVEYATQSVAVRPGSRLYLFSDGAYEVELRDGVWLDYDGLMHELAAYQGAEAGGLDQVYAGICHRAARPELYDDFSLLELRFG